MSINVKTPIDAQSYSGKGQDIAGKGHDPRSEGSSGTYDGLPGVQKRTSSPNAVPEKLIDGTKPAGNLNVKTPSTPVKK